MKNNDEEVSPYTGHTDCLTHEMQK